jgi:hypothetical protein
MAWPTEKSIPLLTRKSFRDAEPKYREHLASIEKKLSYALSLEVDVPAFVADAAVPAAKKEDLGKWLWDLYPQALFKAIGDYCANGPDEAKKFQSMITANTVVVRLGSTGGVLHKIQVENGKLICQVESANLGFELAKVDDLTIDAALSGGSAPLPATNNATPSKGAVALEHKQDPGARPVREPPSTVVGGDVHEQLSQLKLLELRGRIAADNLDFDGEALTLAAKGPSFYSQLSQLGAAATPGNLLLARVSSLLRSLAKENIRHTPTIHAQSSTLHGMDPSSPEPRDAKKLSKYLYARQLRESTPQNPQSFWQVFVPGDLGLNACLANEN